MNKWPVAVVLAFLCTVAFTPAYAQKPKPEDYGIKSKKALEYYFQAQQFAQWRDRKSAVKAYEEAIKLEPAFAHAHYELGAQEYVLKNYQAAKEHLEFALPFQDQFLNLPFYLGEAYFYTHNYDSAAEQLKTFLERGGKVRRQDLEVATLDFRNSLFAREAIKDSTPIHPVNMGENINSQFEEYIPYLTADNQTLMYVSRRNGNTGGYIPQINDYDEDFYFSVNEGDSWSPAKNLGPPINTELNEGAAAMTQDGKTVYFTACNRPDGFGDCDLYVSTWNGKGWSEPKNLGPRVNTEFKETQPSLAHDGKTLYFGSNRHGSVGLGDIWYCEMGPDGWKEAKNMGPAINTEGHEDGPFIHADGQSLYFSSNFHPGFGGADLYVSYKKENGTWGEPINLGYPLNTAGYETNIFITTRGDKGFISAERDGGLGKNDIYEIDIPQAVRPEKSTFFRGLVRDSITRAPVYARLRILDLATGDTIRNVFSGRSDGRFLISLPGGRDYAVMVEASKYLFSSRHFSLKDLGDDTFYDLTIDLSPIRRNIEVVLQNIFFETGAYELKTESNVELEFLRDFIKNNPGLKLEIQGHTDDVGSDADNLALSQKRAEAVRQWLENNGVPRSQLEAKGYGESQPLVPNTSEENRAKNRRTQFKVLEAR